MTGVLRDKLGFKGLIVTDALEMAGVTNAYSTEEASLRSILAGVDMLLLPPEPAKVIAYLAAAVRDGRIPLARIDASVRRILEAKASLGLDRNRFVRIEEHPPPRRPAGLSGPGREGLRKRRDARPERRGRPAPGRRAREADGPGLEQRPRRLLCRTGVRLGDENEVSRGRDLLRRRRHRARRRSTRLSPRPRARRPSCSRSSPG